MFDTSLYSFFVSFPHPLTSFDITSFLFDLSKAVYILLSFTWASHR